MTAHSSPHIGASGQIVAPNDRNPFAGWCVGCLKADESRDGPRWSEALRGGSAQRVTRSPEKVPGDLWTDGSATYLTLPNWPNNFHPGRWRLLEAGRPTPEQRERGIPVGWFAAPLISSVASDAR